MVCGDEPGHVVAHRFDHPCALVAEDDRPAAVAQVSVGEVEVGVADAGRGDTNQDLAALGRIELHFLDGHRQARFAHHTRSHLQRSTRSLDGGFSRVPGHQAGVLSHVARCVKLSSRTGFGPSRSASAPSR